MPQQPNNRYAARQAELDQRLERYIRGDLRALDGFDESGFDEPQRAYESHVDPDAFPTEDGFVHACVADLMAHGELNRGEALAQCHTIWAEHSNDSVSPKLPPALNDGQKQVRAGLERQRPTLDPITQGLWDNYVDARCKAIVEAIVFPFAKHTGKKFRQLVKDIDHNIDGIDKDIAAVSENVKAVTKEMVVQLRENMRVEMDAWARRMDKQFTAEIATLRETTIFRTSENLSVMFADVRKLLRLDSEERITKAREELAEASRKEIADLIKTKEDLLGEITVLRGQVSSLGDDLNATLADVTNSLRDELADEFIKMSEENLATLRKELRGEMRKEFLARIKSFRSIFKKNRKAYICAAISTK